MKHPFAIEANFSYSLVLTYAFPVQQLVNLIPPCLTLDSFNEQWAFVAVAMVKTNQLRPKGFPAFMGQNFFLIGYRIFVRYKTSQGKTLRGLLILESQTDSKRMELMGNWLTSYNYSTVDIVENVNSHSGHIESNAANMFVDFQLNEHDVPLPIHSPFPDWKTARRYAGPLPFTFSFNPQQKKVLIVEGVRNNWVPKPVLIHNASFGKFQKYGLSNGVLANAFLLENIPYYWKRGKWDPWLQ